MFIVDRQSNRISSVQSKSFSELELGERKHLQEWLAHKPSALGEELLIIQKEFDGFNETRERLDLLALDKEGNLVIIENKLDDSGRDMVWQALKYASYCASLTKTQILGIYQDYLQRYHAAEQPPLDATTRICDFLDTPDLAEVKLNLGNSQRIMLVAANFRKEVTSTALWLLGQGISVQCFKVTPYVLADQLLINIDQIIPTPEANELMISMSAKEAEEKSTEEVVRNSHRKRRAYWEAALETFQKSSCRLYDNISPSKDHWLSAGSGLNGCGYNLIFNKNELRIEMSLARRTAEESKFLFDYFYARKEQIEKRFGQTLDWQRLDDRKMSRICFSRVADSFNEDQWSEWIAWHVQHMTRFEYAFKPEIDKAVQAVGQIEKE